jgi:hypothetical protein
MEEEKAELLLRKIIDFSESAVSQKLIFKYNIKYLMLIFDQPKLKQIDQKFKDYHEAGVDILDFIRIFVSLIEHKLEESLYLTLGLIDLFKAISEQNGLIFLV